MSLASPNIPSRCSPRTFKVRGDQLTIRTRSRQRKASKVDGEFYARTVRRRRPRDGSSDGGSVGLWQSRAIGGADWVVVDDLGITQGPGSSRDKIPSGDNGRDGDEGLSHGRRGQESENGILHDGLSDGDRRTLGFQDG